MKFPCILFFCCAFNFLAVGAMSTDSRFIKQFSVYENVQKVFFNRQKIKGTQLSEFKLILDCEKFSDNSAVYRWIRLCKLENPVCFFGDLYVTGEEEGNSVILYQEEIADAKNIFENCIAQIRN